MARYIDADKAKAKPQRFFIDEDRKRANTTTNEFGINDDRVFCMGLYNIWGSDILEKCKHCTAYVENAEQLKGEQNA